LQTILNKESITEVFTYADLLWVSFKLILTKVMVFWTGRVCSDGGVSQPKRTSTWIFIAVKTSNFSHGVLMGAYWKVTTYGNDVGDRMTLLRWKLGKWLADASLMEYAHGCVKW